MEEEHEELEEEHFPVTRVSWQKETKKQSKAGDPLTLLQRRAAPPSARLPSYFQLGRLIPNLSLSLTFLSFFPPLFPLPRAEQRIYPSCKLKTFLQNLFKTDIVCSGKVCRTRKMSAYLAILPINLEGRFGLQFSTAILKKSSKKIPGKDLF